MIDTVKVYLKFVEKIKDLKLAVVTEVSLKVKYRSHGFSWAFEKRAPGPYIAIVCLRKTLVMAAYYSIGPL